MDNIKDIIKDYQIKKEGRSLPAWQEWSLQFCKQYSIPRKDYARVMSVARQYQDRMDYLRYVQGWLSDYPNIRGSVIRLFLWKIGEDKKGAKKESNLIYI